MILNEKEYETGTMQETGRTCACGHVIMKQYRAYDVGRNDIEYRWSEIKHNCIAELRKQIEELKSQINLIQ